MDDVGVVLVNLRSLILWFVWLLSFGVDSVGWFTRSVFELCGAKERSWNAMLV